ncbi:MAG TPA: hypothetical protein VLT90_15200 [Terriglobales bacterium]|nr:hypothetical protein [Terriglobales bacterium]
MRTILQVLLLAIAALVAVAPASAQVGVMITFGPPALPIYEQPACPAENYIWVPGYWAFDYDYDDYYWVPGTWVLAPERGLLWTPGYWAWTGDRFFFHEGYWAREVGFYGGIYYGFGYFGNGYVGGRWDRDHFFYNRSVTNVNVTVVRNVYNTTVINNNVTVNRVSYNGGNGGINLRPTREQEAIDRERHIGPIQAQMQNVQAARGDRQLRASMNQGRPPIAATPQPGRFNDREAVAAREAGAPYQPPANRPARDNARGQRPDNENWRSGTAIHPRDLPPMERQGPPNTGDAKRDQKLQEQQARLQERQEKDRQKLEQKQEREDQKLEQKRADDARRQQTEQRHQQQTQQMEQRHAQQQQKLQPRPPSDRRSESQSQQQERPH